MNNRINLQDDPGRKYTKWSRHVIECPKGDLLFREGDKAEKEVVWYLLENLPVETVGEYRILMNYHMPVRSSGPAQTQEIDLVLIDRLGVYLLEVKDRRGKIVAYDSTWLQDGHDMKGNPLFAIESKARIFKSHWFSKWFGMERVFVKGLVVLARGRATFENLSSHGDHAVVGIDHTLLEAVNPPPGVLKENHRKLSNQEIIKIQDMIFKQHIPAGEVIIEDYRLENRLPPGNMYTAYEARNINLPNQRVRIKIYQSKAPQEVMERIRRDADAVSKLGHHPNILYTINFIPDTKHSDWYYEITELIDGTRLDKFMENRKSSLPLDQQVNYLEQLCAALSHAHSRGIIHRNISPETVYITNDGVVKLADFDFAKVDGFATIVDPSIPLVDSEFTAPELKPDATNASPSSDLYTLGCLWLYMASWPAREIRLNRISSVSLPKAAGELLQALLSPIPAKRPQTADVLLAELQKLENNASSVNST